MHLHTSLLRQLDNPGLSRNERAELRCRLSKELEEAGNYEAARNALGELWQRIGERPRVEGLDPHIAAEVLLRAGSLAGWIGSSQQIEGAQETAKNLISESMTTFESLGEVEKAVEAETDLAYCYWREGAFEEARVILRDVLGRLTNTEGEVKAIALLHSAIVELSANRTYDALRLLTDAAPLIEASSSHALKGKYHGNLGIILKNLSNDEQCEDYLDRALIEYAAASFHYEQAGHTRYRARNENSLGFIYFKAARFNEAHDHLDRARRLFISLKENGSVAQVDETRARTLLAQGRNADAERIARLAVGTLEKGDERFVLAEALATHGTALARLGHYEQARSTLQRAIEVAHQAGSLDRAGQAALTMLEELGERLTLAEMQSIYARADDLLAHSTDRATLSRLRSCARPVVTAQQSRAQIAQSGVADYPTGFVYASEQTASLLRDAHRIASTSSPVLITGETGTGKELLARLIHQWSGRSGEFVALNCVALPDTLIESQLFGHRKGSFTDAIEDYPGAVRQARGGTLFLDEIGELSTGNQSKLLRLVERYEIHPIGAPGPEQVDVRIVAATNCNLKQEVAQGLFRSDLFYRLQTFHLELPPLRERADDIPVLAEHFIKEAFARHGQRVTFTPEAIEAIRQLPLRGNARELRSLIERTMLIAPQGATVTQEAVETLVMRQTKTAGLADAWAGCSLEEEVRLYEGGLIQMALKAAQGHITRAARLLGITHQRLSSILQGRHKALLTVRTPVKRRRRTIIKKTVLSRALPKPFANG
ncbi:MAG: two-component system, NtrC family, response regulator AtoC [Acidobacteriota bacterium]|jgi:DNA-binding NtrC family response regulator|nr:two-component system, NtrC family, response regulator AtoC [Acidobacteriota bacterium]